MTPPAGRGVNDGVTRLLFRFGPRIYGWCVGAGPEVDLRREFASFVTAGGTFEGILDVGCGPAYFAEDALGRYGRYVGCDRSRQMLRSARRFLRRERLGASLVAASALALPFRDASFDLVVATSVVYLLPDPVRALREMARAAKPGGVVGTLDPSAAMTPLAVRRWCRDKGQGLAHMFRMLAWCRAARYYRRYTPASLAAHYADAGLPRPEIREALAGMVLFARVPVPRPSRAVVFPPNDRNGP